MASMELNVSQFSTGIFHRDVAPVNDCSTDGATSFHNFNALAMSEGATFHE